MFLFPLLEEVDAVHALLLGLGYNVNKGKQTEPPPVSRKYCAFVRFVGMFHWLFWPWHDSCIEFF